MKKKPDGIMGRVSPAMRAEHFEMGGGGYGGRSTSTRSGAFSGLMRNFMKQFFGKPAPRPPTKLTKRPPTQVPSRFPTVPGMTMSGIKKLPWELQRPMSSAIQAIRHHNPKDLIRSDSQLGKANLDAGVRAYSKSKGRQEEARQRKDDAKFAAEEQAYHKAEIAALAANQVKPTANPVKNFFFPTKPPGRSPGNQALRDVAKTYPTIIAGAYVIGKASQWLEDRYSTGTESKKHIQHKSPRDYLVGAFGQQAVTRSEAKGKTRKGKSRYGPGTGK